MLRSRTVNKLRELASEGLSIRQISKQSGLSRNTVRKYLRSSPVAARRAGRQSKLDPYKDQIEKWVEKDGLLDCTTMLERLRASGYTGGVTILRDYVHPMRPPRGGHQLVQRYETAPGKQMQIDWGTFMYDRDGVRKKMYGMTAIMSHSRSRFALYSKRCDTASLIRAIMNALEYFGGLPETILSDRMKSVLVRVEDGELIWNSVYADFLAAIGVSPRVCRPRTPQTKGKVERSIGIIKDSFWPGVRFTDIDDLNEQVFAWCEARNNRVHRTTHVRPAERLKEEVLRALPEEYA